MTEQMHGHARMANLGGAALCTKKTQLVPTWRMLADCARKIFPGKTWADLGLELNLEERVAKHRLKGTRKFSLDELRHLLRSEDGFKYLTALMAGAEPKWWRLCVPLMEVAEVQAMQIAARKRLRRAVQGALDADRDTTAALGRADALLVQDADFYRPHADAVGAMAGVPDRAMASPRRPR